MADLIRQESPVVDLIFALGDLLATFGAKKNDDEKGDEDGPKNGPKNGKFGVLDGLNLSNLASELFFR